MGLPWSDLGERIPGTLRWHLCASRPPGDGKLVRLTLYLKRIGRYEQDCSRRSAAAARLQPVLRRVPTINAGWRRNAILRVKRDADDISLCGELDRPAVRAGICPDGEDVPRVLWVGGCAMWDVQTSALRNGMWAIRLDGPWQGGTTLPECVQALCSATSPGCVLVVTGSFLGLMWPQADKGGADLDKPVSRIYWAYVRRWREHLRVEE